MTRATFVAFAAFVALVASSSARADGPAVLRVRAYVDDGFAKPAVVDAKIAAMLKGASALLGPQLGVELQLADKKAWHPSPAAAKNVRAGLAELDDEDKSTDVDLAIGFLGAPPAATDDLHRVALADALGHHAVVKGVDDANRAAVLLAHAVAHALGGVHSTAPAADDIMAPTFSAAQTHLGDDALALTKLGVAWMTAKNEKDRASAAAQLVRELEKRKDKLDAAGAKDVRDKIGELAGTASHDVVLPPEQARVFNDAVVAMNGKDYVGAFAKLKPLADKSDAAQVLALACRLDSFDGVVDPDKARCDRALAASPNDVDTADAAIRAAVHAKDDAALKRAFAQAKARLDKLTVGGPDVAELAALAQGTERISLAEDALAKLSGPQIDELKKKLALERKRAGVPRGSVAPDDEPALFAAVASVEAIKDPMDETSAVESAIKRFGEVPVLLVEKCDALRKRKKYRDAALECEAAVKKYPDGSVAHSVAGMVYDEDDLPAKAITHFEQAIALDPDTASAYEHLDGLYHQVGKRGEQKKLEASYQAKFGKPMPPPDG